MTWILRKIDVVDPWLPLAEIEEVTSLQANPPLWAIRLFIPSAKDEGSLSFYEVDELTDAKSIAAAFGFMTGDMAKAKTKVSFVAVKRGDIEAAGFVIEESDGGLFHHCDKQHRGISPSNLEDAAKLAGLFVAGELATFEGKIVQAAADQEARLDHFEIASLAKTGSQSSAGRNVLTFLSNNVIQAKGVVA